MESGRGLVVFAAQLREILSTELSPRCIVTTCESSPTTRKGQLATGADLCG